MAWHTVAVLIALALAVAAAIWDAATGRVPNFLTAPAALAGLVLGALGGLHTFLLSLAGLAAGVALWFVGAFGGRLMGGGDVKLMAAVGALCGPKFMLVALLAGIFCGGVVAIIYAISNRVLLDSLRRLTTWAWAKVNLRTDIGLVDGRPEKRLPYAIPLGMGIAIAALIL